MAEKNLKITLVKSPIGAVPKHRATVEAMGLTKMHKTVIMPDNASTILELLFCQPGHVLTHQILLW